MKGNIRTKGCHSFKYTGKYNNTRHMILRYVYLKFFEFDDDKSFNDVYRCRYYRVPPCIHKFHQRRDYRIMCICRNNSNMHKFDHDEYRYSMHYMGDYYG